MWILALLLFGAGAAVGAGVKRGLDPGLCAAAAAACVAGAVLYLANYDLSDPVVQNGIIRSAGDAEGLADKFAEVIGFGPTVFWILFGLAVGYGATTAKEA